MAVDNRRGSGLYSYSKMKFLFASILLASAAVVPVRAQTPVLLAKAEVLPLALGDDFEFRKVKTFLHQPDWERSYSTYGNIEQMVAFETKRRARGAVSHLDERERYGNYITLFWRANRPAARIAVRLEYRKQNTGPYVQAREIAYENVKGNQVTEFAVVGDDYAWDGKVTSWRAVLVEDGKIVGITSSFLWN